MGRIITAYLIIEDEKVKRCDLDKDCKDICSITKDSDGVRCPKGYWGFSTKVEKEEMYMTEIEI